MDMFDRWANAFLAFTARFAHLFGRSEPREQMRKYVRAVLATLTRRNGWQLAEIAGDACPDRMQRLLYRAKWEADDARDEVRAYVAEELGDPEGIGIVDETGFLKKGRCSVGVKSQYSGTAGCTANSQVATFLAYATPRGQTLIDRRLYLPAEWCADPERRRIAQVPETVTFQTKPQQALAMLQAAWDAGVPMRWVTGDAIYGDAQYVREAIAAAGRWYVLGVSVSTTVWVTRPPVAQPLWSGHGRRPKHPRVVEPVPPWQTVAQVIAAVPPTQWQRLAVREGDKGPLWYDWTRVRVVERVDGVPGRTLWLLARRSVTDPTDIKYFLAHAPKRVPLRTLAQVAATRSAVEQCFAEAKEETGLDEYEVRRWHSWHRHITLTMMAHAWLTVMRAHDADVVPEEETPEAQEAQPLRGAKKRGPPKR